MKAPAALELLAGLDGGRAQHRVYRGHGGGADPVCGLAGFRMCVHLGVVSIRCNTVSASTCTEC